MVEPSSRSPLAFMTLIFALTVPFLVGRSVFAAALCHASVNVSAFLFPNLGSHYDPRFVAPITVVAAMTVTFFWGSRTLTREGEQSGALSLATLKNQDPEMVV